MREAHLAHHILYLADRNILIDQTMAQDFKPFQKIMTKVKECGQDGFKGPFFFRMDEKMNGVDWSKYTGGKDNG